MGFLWWEGHEYLNLMIILCLMVLMGLYVFTFPKYKTEEITGAFRCMLCSGDAFLFVSDQGNAGRSLSGVADLFKFLGL